MLHVDGVSAFLRELHIDATCRFQELQNSLTGIAATTLSARLKALEEGRIVVRQFYSEHPPRAEYVLTAKEKS